MQLPPPSCLHNLPPHAHPRTIHSTHVHMHTRRQTIKKTQTLPHAQPHAQTQKDRTFCSGHEIEVVVFDIGE